MGMFDPSTFDYELSILYKKIKDIEKLFKNEF